MPENSRLTGQMAASLERLRKLSDERQADLQQQQHTDRPPDDAAQRRAEALDSRDAALVRRAETADRRDETQERRETMLNDRQTALDQREQLLDRRANEDRHAGDPSHADLLMTQPDENRPHDDSEPTSKARH